MNLFSYETETIYVVIHLNSYEIVVYVYNKFKDEIVGYYHASSAAFIAAYLIDEYDISVSPQMVAWMNAMRDANRIIHDDLDHKFDIVSY